MEREIQGEEPSNSVDSFGKLTGLLYDKSQDETTSAPVEENKPKKKTQISIIPGKVTETKIYARLPANSVITTEQSEEQQPEALDQGSTLLLFLLAALLFCACLMASTIAIVSSSHFSDRHSDRRTDGENSSRHLTSLVKLLSFASR